MNSKLMSSIKQHEGFSSTPYKDDKGVWTIGYGTNIENISDIEASFLLQHRVRNAQKDLKKAIDSEAYFDLSFNQKNALVEFMYWLGLPTFRKFKKMIKAINERNYIEASRQMLDSRVGREYKTRTTKLANLLKGDS